MARLHADPQSLTSAVFSIEGASDVPMYRGVHNDRARWNGWAQPLLPRPEVERLKAQVEGEGNDWEEDGVKYNYNTLEWDGDVLVYISTDGERDPETGKPFTYRERIEPVVVDGVLLYDVGFGWVWDTVTCGLHDGPC